MKTKYILGSKRESLALGVCAGLANAFKVDPFYVRGAFILGTLLGGPGGIIYIALYFIMENPSAATKN